MNLADVDSPPRVDLPLVELLIDAEADLSELFLQSPCWCRVLFANRVG